MELQLKKRKARPWPIKASTLPAYVYILLLVFYGLSSMTKRGTGPGGYLDSSDVESDLGFVAKRPKSVPYEPPRFTSTPRFGSGGFQLPGPLMLHSRASTPSSCHVSAVSSSSRTTPAPGIGGTAHAMQAEQRDSTTVPEAGTAQPNQASASTNIEGARKSESAPGHVHNTSRTSLVLERQMNQLNDSFEGYWRDADQRYQDTNKTLAAILAAIKRLESASVEPSQAQTPTVTMPSGASSRIALSNPPPTPELVNIVSKVVAEHKSRIGVTGWSTVGYLELKQCKIIK
ncbi:hypothetical protein RhiJN_13932 [Ceratobasidium sp. AG-Ba]|nr:hypothetical protein RhiJN_13932 [Ceratobasidium sp. AG-Ba]QRW14490.1 hypothetical protein RhiLY_13489 [Ceratobasidium sp. AG-Ba]